MRRGQAVRPNAPSHASSWRYPPVSRRATSQVRSLCSCLHRWGTSVLCMFADLTIRSAGVLAKKRTARPARRGCFLSTVLTSIASPRCAVLRGSCTCACMHASRLARSVHELHCWLSLDKFFVNPCQSAISEYVVGHVHTWIGRLTGGRRTKHVLHACDPIHRLTERPQIEPFTLRNGHDRVASSARCIKFHKRQQVIEELRKECKTGVLRHACTPEAR
jgi:hypothetical protein